MLKTFTASFADRPPMQFEAHSIMDAKWRLRQMLGGVGMLPAGTIVSRSSDVKSIWSCGVTPREVTVELEEPGFSVMKSFESFKKTLLCNLNIVGVATDPLRVTYKIPDGVPLKKHIREQETYIRDIWRRYARESN